MKAIFFDLDDTLSDHSSAARAGVEKVYEKFHAHIAGTLEDFLGRWETISERYFGSTELFHKFTFEQQRRMRIRDIFSVDMPDDEADHRFGVYEETYEAHWRLFPDALPCLRVLQGKPLGLITNGGKEMHRAKIKKLDLGPFFSTIIISREVDLAKPEKAIFELAAREAKTDIRECVYVGDRLETDALGSQRAGMKGIWLDRKGKWDGKDVGVPVVRDLREFTEMLKKV